MAAERPQYYTNTLKPIEINHGALQQTLTKLRDAARNGAEMVQKGSPPPDEWGMGGFFLGNPGVTLAFLRLDHQAASLAKEDETSPPDFRKYANKRTFAQGPGLPLLPSRLSPLGSLSPLPAAVLRILAAASSNTAVSKDDIGTFHRAVELALKNGHVVPHNGENFGGDEILYGRAGLLWSILIIRAHKFDGVAQKALSPLFESVPKLVDMIVEGGRQCASDCSKKYGPEHTMPLMYMWMEGFYCLGLIHGVGGILSTLLACNTSELNNSSRNYYPEIAATITSLCKITISSNGHLPTCIPPRQVGSLTSAIVQICHGSPGFLVFMACAIRNPHLMAHHWVPEWDRAIQLAAGRIWEEGLLSKGGGLCHGIAGNAWPLLLMHDCFEYDGELMDLARRNYQTRAQTKDYPLPQLTGDYFLSRALAFLLHVRETPPYTSPSSAYPMPSIPYALTEGLPGTVCAWSESCVVIQARLRKMELDEKGETSAAARAQDAVFRELDDRHLPFPSLPYHRPVRMF